jgi:hypothetical protein
MCTRMCCVCLSGEMSIADFFALGPISCAFIIHADLSAFKNVTSWLDRMRSTKMYRECYGPVLGWAQSLKGKIVGFDAAEGAAAVASYAAEFKDCKPLADPKKFDRPVRSSTQQHFSFTLPPPRPAVTLTAPLLCLLCRCWPLRRVV